MNTAFDTAEFVRRSRALDLSGVPWEKARSEPVSRAERRMLAYFIDVEAYTIAYLRALLNTSAVRDPEIGDFLACWAYEEAYHGRALERFLEQSGRGLDPARPRSVQRPPRLLESLQDLGAALLSGLLGRDFVAAHMTWGAIQELTTLNGYRRLALGTRNGALAEIVRRIMRDESRHFGFYYHQANERLAASARARRLTAALVRHFWKPVGAGIMPDGELVFLTRRLFGSPEGLEAARGVDAAIARLPGMSWFRGVERHLESCLARPAPADDPGEHDAPSLTGSSGACHT